MTALMDAGEDDTNDTGREKSTDRANTTDSVSESTEDHAQCSAGECSGECDPGTDTTRSCNVHPGHDGIGECRAGTQTCMPQDNGEGGVWSQCQGDVGPSIEACGPDSPDSNCNGIRGDGDGCLKKINIYAQTDTVNECGDWEGKVIFGASTENAFYASTDTPPYYYDIVGTFYVFKEPLPGMMPLRNCWEKYDEYSERWGTYVTIGDTCAPLSDNIEWDEVEIVGYVSNREAEGYRRLSQVTMTNTYYINNNFDVAHIPVTTCPSQCDCALSNAYVIR